MLGGISVSSGFLWVWVRAWECFVGLWVRFVAYGLAFGLIKDQTTLYLQKGIRAFQNSF